MKTTSQTTGLGALVKDYVTYNLWANQQLVTWLNSKPQHLLKQEVLSSFSSLEATLLHIWDVERGWLGHLKQSPVPAFRWEGFDGSLDDIMEGIINTSKDFFEYAVSLTEEDIESGRFFSIPYVGDHTMPAFEIIQHAMNHSTYHRGQLTTIGRNVGITDAPMTDYMFYLLRAKSSTKKQDV